MKKRFHKKNIARALAITLCLVGVVGCGSNYDEKSDSDVVSVADANKDINSNSEIALDSGKESSQEVASGISEDFIMGMDASSVLVEENSGVKYYDFDGNEADVFKVLADSGINYIRIRVWNDPYDADGNGYGGGNNDVATAIELGKRATEYGMKVCIDFHYSDFWADPKRQHAPKAWEGMTIDEKCTALSEFTTDSLAKMLDAGVDIGMVQVGNEINYGMSGEYTLKNVTKLLDAGCDAVRSVGTAYNKNITIAIHYTNIENKGEVDGLVHNLVNNDIDFDAIGLSYYPFWDGSFDNMKSMVSSIQKRHGKKVFIAETSYCYTSEDGDGTANSLSGTNDLVEGYPATVQGQVDMLRDVIINANEAGAFGVFYWEGTWIPVGSDPVTNAEKWEKYGSGWASSYAGDYDPEDAGLYYGGCSWDNQALFDFEGHPLESLEVYNSFEISD